VENVPEPGPAKKPQRRIPTKPGTGARKPAPARKPAAKPTAKPTGRPSGSSAAARASAQGDTTPSAEATEPETADAPTTIEQASPKSEARSSGVLGFTVPKLSIPTIMLGRSKGADTAPVERAEPEASDEAPESELVLEPEVDPDTQPEVDAETEPETEVDAERKPEPESESEPEPEKSGDIVAVVQPATKSVARKKGKTVQPILRVDSLTKRFDDKLAVNDVHLEIAPGAFYGIVGPNGAGKTTTLSMITGLLRPTAGTVTVHGSDVWSDPVVAKRNMGVLPDRLRLFDRLTGAQLLFYAGALRGMDGETVRARTSDLAHAFGLEASLSRLVSDYSAGMTKKIALAAAMIHSPRLLVLDEPFESVDPVSSATVTEILQKYVAAGGTVLLSSHSMDLVQRICDSVAVIVDGSVLADGTMAAVRNGRTLEERFVELAGGRETVEGLEWLHSFSD
jgi:ABC-2 type transport system ATP-binding protein